MLGVKAKIELYPAGASVFDHIANGFLSNTKEGGFYMRAEGVGGARRAFATIPSLSPLLGGAVWQWARALEGRGPLDLVEVGAGGGHLAKAILDAAGWWGRRSLRYHIVEISPTLRQAQAALLAGRKVAWHDSVEAALEAADRAAIVSNELVDAFPVHCIRRPGGSGRWAWPRRPAAPRACCCWA